MGESIRTVGNRKVKFTWHGGEYIELGWVGYSPVEVINVYDYEKGEPSIPRTKPAFRKAITDWIEDYGERELEHDLEQHHF